MKIKKMQLLEGCQPYQKLHGIDDNLFYTYFEHELEVFITDSTERIVCNTGTFLEADIGGFNIILG